MKKQILLTFLMVIYSILFCQFASAQVMESTNFKIEGDNISPYGMLGTSNSYQMSGEFNGIIGTSTSPNFINMLGFNPRINANRPNAPVLSNAENYYNKLTITIDPSNNPSDTLYAVAVTYDDWNTTKYLKSDYTINDTLTYADYMTYSSLGGASGTAILGLSPNLPYKAKVKALKGDFTETNFGLESNEMYTSTPFIRYTLSLTSVPLGVLSYNEVTSSNTQTITIDTNADNGYDAYVYGTGNTTDGGLYNSTAASLIESLDTTLLSGTEGYGMQASSSTATINIKYNVTGDEVGAVEISSTGLASNISEVTGEDINVVFKASMAADTIAGDYIDTVYYTVSPSL